MRRSVGEVADEDVASLAELPGWTVDGPAAVYRPVEGGWSATVRLVDVIGHAYKAWHVALVDPRNRVQFTRRVSRLEEARRVAEGMVRAQNAAG